MNKLQLFRDSLNNGIPARDALTRAFGKDDWSPEARAAAAEARKHNTKGVVHERVARSMGQRHRTVGAKHEEAAAHHFAAQSHYDAAAHHHTTGNHEAAKTSITAAKASAQKAHETEQNHHLISAVSKRSAWPR